MKAKNLILIILLLILGVLLFALSNQFINELNFLPPSKQIKTVKENKLLVMASSYPMYFFSTQIGGEKADVVNITPTGIEPHDFEPTVQDIARISKSSMLVINGGGFETWGEKIKNQLQDNQVEVVIAGDNLIDRNPHIWLDPILAKKEAENIKKGYQKIDPKNSAYFQANFDNLANQLDDLNKQFEKGLGNCQKRDFVTAHASFDYLANRYNLNQISISGISPDQEPSLQKLAEITDFVKRQDIKVIFFETLISPKLSQTIAAETGAEILVLDPIEGISDDDIKMGKNYFTVMEENLNNLQVALQCQ